MQQWRNAIDNERQRHIEPGVLPREMWTHEAHVRVDRGLLRELPFEKALDRTRRAVQRLNVSHRPEAASHGGYHNTVVVAFMRQIAAAMRGDECVVTVSSASSMLADLILLCACEQ